MHRSRARTAWTHAIQMARRRPRGVNSRRNSQTLRAKARGLADSDVICKRKRALTLHCRGRVLSPAGTWASFCAKISYVKRGSKRDPSKTAFTRDRLSFPRSKWSKAPPKPAFAGASFGGLYRRILKPASPRRSSTVAELLFLKLNYCWLRSAVDLRV